MNMEDKQIKENIADLLNAYFELHPFAKEVGGEYIYQDDKAQTDAIELVSNICELFCK